MDEREYKSIHDLLPLHYHLVLIDRADSVIYVSSGRQEGFHFRCASHDVDLLDTNLP